jgi:hypothetical protein
MKTISALFTLLVALTVSAVAAYFSVVGLAALFAATFVPVVIMGTTLEIGKLVAVQWLHMNWSNPNVNWLHRTYKTLAIIALMLITSIGIYGFLSKGHLEQEAPLEGIELQIGQREQQIKVLTDSNTALQTKLTQLDKSIDSFLSKDKASQGLKARNSQKGERATIDNQIATNNEQINKLNSEILPLKMQSSEVHAKLGPIKYVAELLGWQDTNSAVRLVILILMFAFDPFAIVMLISATITFKELGEEREAKQAQAKQEAKEAQMAAALIADVQIQEAKPDELRAQSIIQTHTLPQVEEEVVPDVDLVSEQTTVEPVLHIEHDDEHHELEDEPEEFVEEDHIIEAPIAEAPVEDPQLAEYRAALEKFVSEAYKQDKSPAVDVVPTPTEKQQLIELLEKQPGLLEVMIDVISTYKQPEAAIETPELTNEEPLDTETPSTLDPTPTKPRNGWL